MEIHLDYLQSVTFLKSVLVSSGKSLFRKAIKYEILQGAATRDNGSSSPETFYTVDIDLVITSCQVQSDYLFVL